MKKTLALLLAVLMLVSVLSACGTTAETPAAPTAEATAETMGTETPEEESALEAQDLIFATMDVGTSIYTYSSAIANILLEYLPEGSTIDVPTTSPGGLGAAYLLAQGKSDLIIVNDVGFISSIEGGVLGEASIDSNLVAGIVGSMDWPHVDILVRNDYAEKNGVNSIEEVIEKKIPTNFVIKQAGTMGELAFVQLLEGLGVTEEELTGWGCTITRTASGNIKTAMQDGTGDITVDHPPNNQANTVELTLNTPCTLWDIPESVRDYNPTCTPCPEPGKAAWPGLRCPVAVALSEDGGKTFPLIRHMELGEGFVGAENSTNNRTYEYPYLMQGRDGRLYLAFAYSTRRSVKWMSFTEEDVAGAKREVIGLYNPTAAKMS